MKSKTVDCPICGEQVSENSINDHLDTGCSKLETDTLPMASSSQPSQASSSSSRKRPLASIFVKKQPDPPESPTVPKLKKQHQVIDLDTDEAKPPPAKRQKTSAEHLDAAAPLAARLRPKTLEDFVGQDHLTGADSLLMSLVHGGGTGSLILWGPPGCGKTTLARLLAHETGAAFKELSATSSGAVEARNVCEEAKNMLKLRGRRTVLFLDEIHRFNKAQQDIFLPYVEAGHIQLIGATTENPSFKVNGALISRCRVFVLERLTDDQMSTILTRAIDRYHASLPEPASNHPINAPSEKILTLIIKLANGDSRTALSLLELTLTAKPGTNEAVMVQSLKRSVATSYDRSGDDHYDMISALHKSVRGSDGSAALYWLARMLTGGEDPTYIARRLIVMASEDIGLADNSCLPLAIATHAACQTVGMPECRINLAHCVARFAEAPKSTRSYEGYNRAEEAAKKDPRAPVPTHLRNAPTQLMKELGYGKEYLYNPTYGHPVRQDYLPVAALEKAGLAESSERAFLRKEGDLTDKVWNEGRLEEWEWFENDGKPWEGRMDEAVQKLQREEAQQNGKGQP
ncbi:hypothetical protein BKA62DRAFT_699922 [Auriculariales sp. MPI-PUGE-AT-0066]|nr:hypothetical protein BKA62DRAFT_699922 [Auriculariales sp. MPI-PUGE-AT-0066]